MEWLDEQEFYELMQAYRHAPLADQAVAVAAFEAVKQIIRNKCQEIEEHGDIATPKRLCVFEFRGKWLKPGTVD